MVLGKCFFGLTHSDAAHRQVLLIRRIVTAEAAFQALPIYHVNHNDKTNFRVMIVHTDEVGFAAYQLSIDVRARMFVLCFRGTRAIVNVYSRSCGIDNGPNIVHSRQHALEDT